MSALVRDKLWERVCQNAQGGACVMIHNAASEQGFSCRFWGVGSRVVEDFDGLTLVRILGSEKAAGSTAETGVGQ
jgi:CRISPR-associated protein Cas2